MSKEEHEGISRRKFLRIRGLCSNGAIAYGTNVQTPL